MTTPPAVKANTNRHNGRFTFENPRPTDEASAHALLWLHVDPESAKPAAAPNPSQTANP